MTIENNKITFIAEADYDNLFIPANVDGIIPEEYAIGFAAITPKTITVEEGNRAFYVQNNCLIERATKTLVVAGENAVIPDDGSVEIINDCAFNGNRTLTQEFVIPEGVKVIGEMAFKDTNIEKFFLPASVEEIAPKAFLSIDKVLKEMIIEKTNPHFCVESNCLIFRDTDTVIFIVNRNVGEVVIPDGVKYIENGVFFLAHFDKVRVPASLDKVGPFNFSLTDRGISCRGNALFGKFCSENNIEYGG